MTTTLSGIVKAEGSPATIATIELLNSSGDVIDQVQVDDEGRYLYYLAQGEWRLNCWDARGHRARAEVFLSDGEHKVLDIDLE